MCTRWLIVACAAGGLATVAPTLARADELRVQECLARAATAFDVDVVALQILRELEGGHAGTASVNTNGTYDYGPMQVNSRWAGQLARVGVSMEALRDDVCVNTFVAAWIFKDALAQSSGNTVMAMARYHSQTPYYQVRYLTKALDVVRRHLANSTIDPTSPMEQQQ